MTARTETFDVVIIGGGHNGLTTAGYLARAGLSVKVIEKREVVGGAAVTEEFHPGYRNSAAAYTVSLLNPKVINDLELHAFGLEVVERKVSNFWPMADGRYLEFNPDFEITRAELAKFSEEDAKALSRYYADLERIADVLRGLVLKTPPNVGSGWIELIKAARIGNDMRALSLEDQRLLLDLFTTSAADFLDGYFESDAVKAAFSFDGIVGFYGSPYTPGSAYVLLHHAFGEVNGKKGVWGHAIGGMGAITQAMAKSALAHGASIATGVGVREVIMEGGRACGVLLEDGSAVRAKAVVANVGPKLLFSNMIAAEHLPEDFRRRMENFKCGSGTFRMNVALSELPNFTCRPSEGEEDFHSAGIVIGSTMEYLDRAYTDARAYGWSREPIIEMLIPSTLDKTLAPEGHHVASLFCQQFAPELAGGRSWDDAREEAADLIIDTVNAHAPNFKASVLARQIHSPLDLERKFGLVGGDIFHGRLSLDQMFSARPMLGFADHRTPVKGLYLCGSGTHPGGGVTGAPGHNASREILKDFRWRKV